MGVHINNVVAVQRKQSNLIDYQVLQHLTHLEMRIASLKSGIIPYLPHHLLWLGQASAQLQQCTPF